MLRETGSTRVMGGVPGSAGSGDSTLRAVLSAAAGQYELLGEMGRGVAGTIAYLAREVDSSQLVVLRLDPAQSGDGSVLSVVHELNASTPGGNAPCPACGAAAIGWGRFCPTCGTDLAEAGAIFATAPASGRDGRRETTPEGYHMLGSIPRAGGQGAGAVSFARELATGSVVALAASAGSDGNRGGPSSGFRVLQTMLPLIAAATSSAAPPSDFCPGSDQWPPQPPQPPRAQPTAHRSSPQEVLIPADDLASPDDRLPPRPPRRIPRWWIASAALFIAVLIGLTAFIKVRASRPDGTEARLGSGRMGVALAAASPPSMAAPAAHADSSFIRIAGRLPAGTSVTIDGLPISDESMSLQPGEYVMAASAPGYIGVSERLSLEAGQTLVWIPTLAAEVDRTPSRAASAKPSHTEKKRAPAKADTPLVVAAAPTVQSCQSAFDSQDWTSAAARCAIEAREGTVSAQRNLGVMYDRGVGVPRDPVRAADWLRTAAGAGSRDAAYQLGSMYESGRGVAKDAAQAVAWYRKAALLGDREAQVKVGKAYEQGQGAPADMGEALTWYRKAAGQGDAWAQNYIGFLYGNGKGVPHDDVEALEWFRQAAANGNAQAEYNVGFMYANGRGVRHSDEEAVRWYRQAARHGYDEAMKELERRGLEP